MKKILLLLAILLLVGACASTSYEGRPTEDQLAARLTVTAKEASAPSDGETIACEAKVLEKSELSDEALWQFIDEKVQYELTAKEKKLLAKDGELWAAMQSCQFHVGNLR